LWLAVLLDVQKIGSVTYTVCAFRKQAIEMRIDAINRIRAILTRA